MNLDIKAPITVKTLYNHKKSVACPIEILWEGVGYKIKSVDLHYTYRNGKTLFHAFTAVTSDMMFKLILNTDNLFWTVEQISDGLPD